jgi:hypothetical protein
MLKMLTQGTSYRTCTGPKASHQCAGRPSPSREHRSRRGNGSPIMVSECRVRVLVHATRNGRTRRGHFRSFRMKGCRRAYVNPACPSEHKAHLCFRVTVDRQVIVDRRFLLVIVGHRSHRVIMVRHFSQVIVDRRFLQAITDRLSLQANMDLQVKPQFLLFRLCRRRSLGGFRPRIRYVQIFIILKPALMFVCSYLLTLSHYLSRRFQ